MIIVRKISKKKLLDKLPLTSLKEKKHPRKCKKCKIVMCNKEETNVCQDFEQ